MIALIYNFVPEQQTKVATYLDKNRKRYDRRDQYVHVAGPAGPLLEYSLHMDREDTCPTLLAATRHCRQQRRVAAITALFLLVTVAAEDGVDDGALAVAGRRRVAAVRVAAAVAAVARGFNLLAALAGVGAPLDLVQAVADRRERLGAELHVAAFPRPRLLVAVSPPYGKRHLQIGET